MKYIFSIIALSLIVACNDHNADDLSMRVGKITVFRTQKGNIYFYRIVNGLSTDAYFLTSKENICEGLNKNEDFYFMVLGPTIYYKAQADTIYIYTNLPADQPGRFSFNVVQTKIQSNENDKYENMFLNGEIKKVVIDSMYVPKCNVKF